MKKFLSFALVLSLLFVSLCSFPVSAASNPTSFDDPGNWTCYSNNVGIGTTATKSSWAKATQNTDTSKTYGGDATSLRFNAYATYSSVKLDVKPNTEYTFTYYMMYDGTNSTEKILSHSAIVSPGGTAEWGKDGCYDIYTTAGSAKCDSGLWATSGGVTSTTSTRGNVTQWKDGGVWHKVTHSFNSGNNEEMYFVFRFTAANNNNFYVDELQLKEISSFENLSNWGIYQTSSTDASYTVATCYDGETRQTKMGWCNITNDSTVDADGTGKAVKIYGNAFNVAANFPTLMANTEYTLSFKYKPGSTSTVASSTNSYFTSHIIKKGTGFNQWNAGPETYVATVPSGTATTDWKEVSVTFTTDNSTEYMLEFRFAFTAGYTCYLDDFSLKAKIVHPQLNDWKVYGTSSTYVNETNGTLAGSWATVTNCEDEKYINSGDIASLKLHTTSQFATYKFPVEKNAKYTVSYNFMSETASTSGYIISRTGVLAEDSSTVWAAEKGYYNLLSNNIAYTAKDGIFADKKTYSDNTTNYATTNTWHNIELEFESGNNDYMYLTIFSAVDDLYVDEITVTLVESYVTKISTAYNNAAALRTANASSTGKNGLRVYNSISKEYLSSENVTEYGSIATRKELLGGSELTLNSDKMVKGVAYNSTTQTTPILYDETDDSNVFTSYLVNIPTSRYDEEFVVRAYVIEEDGTVYYGDTVTVCVFDIAYAIDCGNSADGSAQTDADKAAFEAFANYDGNYAAYDAWLAANGKTAGTLRNPA